MNPHQAPTALIILDGFGYSPITQYNAIAQAKTPHLDVLYATHAHTLLAASGTAVGLLDGMIGNSEVGHMTIGCGQIIPQPITLLHHAIENGTLKNNTKLAEALSEIKTTSKRLHIIGLLSDGGVHAHINHIIALMQTAQQAGISHIFIHPILDGRDVAPKSAEEYLKILDNALPSNASIASIAGRFYAMDRDHNWERTKQYYRMLTTPSNTFQLWRPALHNAYKKNITDEFITPLLLDPAGIIRDGDGIIFANYRPDRARQLAIAFTDQSNPCFERKDIRPCVFVTPVPYGAGIQTTSLYLPHHPQQTLMHHINHAGLRSFTIAETEKYAHLTYFFNGGREEPYSHEKRVMIPSRPMKNYVSYPEMSAPAITAHILASLQEDPRDFYLVNYANADMVGHSGNLPATIKAIECLDEQLGKLINAFTQHGGSLYITADHGNAELKFDEKTGQPHTAHTTNPVPFIAVNKKWHTAKHLELKELADIAPFIIHELGIIW